MPQPNAPDTHVCTSLCEGIASLPKDRHESLIAQFTLPNGEKPVRLVTQDLSITDFSVLPHETNEGWTELDQRRFMEGNIEDVRVGLDLPTTYKYPPLRKGHSRFLRTIGMGAHPMASLESHPLENPPPYIAISYFWDSTSPRRGMFVDKKSFGVSETVLEVLNQALASQMSRESHILLWIDQICINQNDQEEKLDQIYRMSEIYSKADRVFIWLGPTANESDFALENMGRMRDEVASLNEATLARADVGDDVVTTINKDHGHIYGHLIMRSWFRRMWTVQEALLARKLVVMCGYREVDFGLLVSLCRELLRYGSNDLIRIAGVSDRDLDDAIVNIISLSTTRRPGASPSEVLEGLDIKTFGTMVTRTRTRHVTMAPDRVHALMGVAPRQVREYMARIQNVQPNISMWQLYAHFAKCILENDPAWYFLSFAPSRSRPKELPSWVPNFDSRQPFASEFTQASCLFSAGISQETRHLINRTITTEELTARGFRLATVSEIVPQTAFTEETANTTRDDAYGAAASEWEQKCSRLCQRLYGLGPDVFPERHIEILLAASAAEPAMGGRAMDAYHVLWAAVRVRDAALQQIRERGESVIPDQFRGLPDAVERFADHVFKVWQNGLPAEEYWMLLGFSGKMKNMCAGRPYIRIDIGTLGLGCPGVEVGDVICILYGTTVPYVLRPRLDGAMTFVGDAYVHNAMNGQAITSTERGPDEMIRIR